MAKTNNVFVPQIAVLLVGVSYDMALSQQVSHKNQFTQHPIEDPTRSFLMDHNRERPITMRLEVRVTSNPKSGPSGFWRAPVFLEALNRIKALQAVSPDAFIPIFDGSRIYRNMAFETIDMKRDNNVADTFLFTIGLHEFRFARRPRQSARQSSFEGSDGPRNTSGRRIVAETDRPIIESTQVRSSPRTGPVPDLYTTDLQNIGAAI